MIDALSTFLNSTITIKRLLAIWGATRLAEWLLDRWESR